MQRAVLVGWIAALAIVAAAVAYWFVHESDVATRAATAAPEKPREVPVFLHEPEAPAPSAPTTRAQVDEPVETKSTEPTAAASSTTSDATLTGVVVDRAHVAIADARIASKYPVCEANSDALGRFELHCALVADGSKRPLRLVVRHAGYGPLRLERSVAAGDNVDLGELVLTPGGAISGRVTDEQGQPFAGAEVRVTNVETVPNGPAYHGPSGALVESSVDAGGNFRVTDVPAGRVRVWAGADEFLWAVSEPIDVPERGEAFGVELVLRKIERENLIRMTVVDPQGAPVPRAKIAYFVTSSGGSWSGSTNVDENGRYTHYLQARAPHDFRASDPENRYRPAVANGVQPGTLDLVLRLAPSRRLTLVVHDTQGGAVERYRVNRKVQRAGSTMSETLVEEGLHPDGRAEFELPVESVELEVDASGCELSQVPLDPETVGAELLITLTTLPGVRGKVLAAGRPIAGARVTLNAEVRTNKEYIVNGFLARSQRSHAAPAITDADGAFAVTLRERDRYYVRAVADDWAPGEIGPLELDPASGASELVIELVRGGTVEGRVLVKPGESSANVIVGASRGDGFAVTTRSDVDGKYGFTELTPGHWWIGRHDQEIRSSSVSSRTGDTQRPAEIPWNCVVRDGEATRFDVEPPPDDLVHLRGRVVYGDKPAVDWQANLSTKSQGANPGRTARLDRDGRFELGAREPGEFYLVLSSSFAEERFQVYAPLSLHAGDNEFALDTQVGRIEGRVALANIARYSFGWSWSDKGVQVTGSFTPDPDGRFVLAHVPVGRVSLNRWDDEEDSGANTIDVQVEAGATTRADL